MKNKIPKILAFPDFSQIDETFSNFQKLDNIVEVVPVKVLKILQTIYETLLQIIGEIL